MERRVAEDGREKTRKRTRRIAHLKWRFVFLLEEMERERRSGS